MSEEMYRIEFEIDDEKVESEGVYVLDSIYTAVREECEEHGMKSCGEGCYEISAEGNFSRGWQAVLHIYTPEIRKYLKKLTWHSDPENITEDVLEMKTIEGDQLRKQITFKINVQGLKTYYKGTRNMLLKKAVDELAALLKEHGFERSVLLGGYVSAYPMTYSEVSASVTPDILNSCAWTKDCLTSYSISSVGEAVDYTEILKNGGEE